MLNNDILRRFRYALDLSDVKMMKAFKLSGYEIDKESLLSFLKKEDEEGYAPCNDRIMSLFLDGFITLKRGAKEEQSGEGKKAEKRLTNNIILKKMRIALSMNSEDVLEILKLAGVSVSKSELSALFRREGHKHYKECGDQFLRNFLKGLTIRYRKTDDIPENLG